VESLQAAAAVAAADDDDSSRCQSLYSDVSLRQI